MVKKTEKSPQAGTVDCYGVTDIGKKRRVNEDQFLIAELNKSMLMKQSSLSIDDETRQVGSPQGQLFLVADGMGGNAAGDRASTIAVDTVRTYVLNMMPWFFKLDASHQGELREELKTLLEECQTKIQRSAARNAERLGMGTTLTMAYVLWPNVYVVHVGDSRCYLRRGDRLEQITKDHTVAQQLVDGGALKASEAEENRLSHVLWNALGGTDDSLNPDVYHARLDLGDALLLATDGLNKHVSDPEILKFLQADESAEETANRLIKAANDAGGSDNVTVLIARFEKTNKLAAVGTDDHLAEAASKEIALPPQTEAPQTPQEAFLKNLEAQIEEWQSGIASLKSASERYKNGEREKCDETIDRLQENLKAAQAVRNEVLSSKEQEGTWDSMKERVEQTWSSLKDTFTSILSP
jgi:protein phosphatase